MQRQEDDDRRVRFDDDDLYRPQTTLEGLDRAYGDEGSQAESARRRSSSDPSGRSRRPRLAVLRPHGNNNAVLARVPEEVNRRIGSTACFNAPGGRNAVNAELADVLDVIGAFVLSPRPRPALLFPFIVLLFSSPSSSSSRKVLGFLG